jgi:hypothetical protein
MLERFPSRQIVGFTAGVVEPDRLIGEDFLDAFNDFARLIHDVFH